ncbi:hypothetical protein LDO26_17815 [Luteimonas sp. BDR2-5]|uniref:hypothetical protein n=1 Tax=Proluteimonas luteida TaxID=2878685 RepID=UPI001E48CEB1|nr:hypothetical protein [Luteimonas sp. BDR2-5]MCD9030049.1 hypothetical protein [Luteimonas sp. BDR2-5]
MTVSAWLAVTARTVLVAGIGCAMLSGCASSPGPQVSGSGRCDDSSLDWAVDQPANEENMRRIARESGAGLINPIGPATNLRRDHRVDRLRVFIDAGNVIQAVRCE